MKTEVNAEKYERKENRCRKNIGKDIKIKEGRRTRKKRKQMHKNRGGNEGKTTSNQGFNAFKIFCLEIKLDWHKRWAEESLPSKKPSLGGSHEIWNIKCLTMTSAHFLCSKSR